MKEATQRKLDRIDELFPPERVEASKNRIRALKRNQAPAGRHPFIFANLGFDYYDDVMPAEERLDRTLDEIIAHGLTQDDFIPHFFPGCRVATIPGMFGAKENVNVMEGGRKEYAVCDRLLGDGDDPRELPDPAIHPGGIAASWLEMQDYVLNETEGRLPVSVIDMQGPMDVAAQLWGYDNLFIDAMGDGEKTAILLEKCADAFIELWQEQVRLLGDHFVGTHLWGWSWVEQGPGHGGSLSMDCLAMISAEFFAQHTRHHLARISEALGGLTIHSCGDFSAVVPGIAAVRGVHGVNASQMSLQQLLDAGVDPAMIITVWRGIDDLEQEYRLISEHSLNVEMTIGGAWPEQGKHPDQWNESEKTLFKRRENDILKLTAR